MIDLKVLTSEIQALEALPATVVRLAALISKEDWSHQQVEEIISLDVGLTSSLLRLANSAAFGASHSIASVREAVIRLGAGSALSLAMAASVHSRLDRSVPEYGLSEGELWVHSVAAALAAEDVAATCGVPVPPEAFTAALLHDLGKLLICRHLRQHELELIGRARTDGGLTRIEAEIEVLGIHHGELGGLIAQRWNLPEAIVKGIQYHHDPDAGGATICDVVWAANLVAHCVLDSASDMDGRFEEACGARLGLDESTFAALAERVGSDLNDRLRAYS